MHRVIACVIILAAGLAAALVGYQSFLNTFVDFLDVLAFIFLPWSAINILDFYFFRHGEYDITSLYTPRGIYGRFQPVPIACYLLGVVVELLFINQSFYTGPLLSLVGGNDISWIVGFIVPLVAYWIAGEYQDGHDDRRDDEHDGGQLLPGMRRPGPTDGPPPGTRAAPGQPAATPAEGPGTADGHRHHRRRRTDPVGRAFRPGRMHDQTAVRTEGIADLFDQFPRVKAKVDAGYRGLAREFPDQAQAPPLKPEKDAPPEETAAWNEQRHRQSSQRICVEHANAEHKQWRTLQRYLGRREDFDETYMAVADLVSDRAAERQPTRPTRQASTPSANRAPRRYGDIRRATRGDSSGSAAALAFVIDFGEGRITSSFGGWKLRPADR